MNKLYKNKDWLEKKYIEEEKLDRQIAKMCRVNQDVIGNWRKKFNIKTRSCGEREHLSKGNHCNLSSESLEWINGELLGDGRLNSISPYSAQFLYSSSKEEYINYVSKTLNSFGIKQTGKIYKSITKINNYGPYFGYYYFSLNYEELLPIWKKWYPNGKKIVPKDLILTPLTCRQWYIGDGCLDCLNRHPCIILSTQGFTTIDVERLKKELIKLGLNGTRQPASNIIHISVYSTKDFLNYIGPCPVKCYQYKWNYYKKKEDVK